MGKSLSEQMDNTQISAPSEDIVGVYEKKPLWSRFVESIDNWHRWVDLLLKIGVSFVIIWLLCKWINFVIRVIELPAEQQSDTSVQIALVTGTSVNLIGLLAIMAKYLFPDNKQK